jgi:hypothetical protein
MAKPARTGKERMAKPSRGRASSPIGVAQDPRGRMRDEPNPPIIEVQDAEPRAAECLIFLASFED